MTPSLGVQVQYLRAWWLEILARGPLASEPRLEKYNRVVVRCRPLIVSIWVVDLDDNRLCVLAVEGEHPISARTVIIRSEPDVRSDRL